MRSIRVLRAGAALVTIEMVTACGSTPLPLGASEQSRPLHEMWIVFFWCGAAIAVLVYGLIGWCILRYRRRPTDTDFPKQFRRNTVLEIVYTVIPIVIVVALFAVSYPAERQVEAIAAQPGVVVNVTGFRWSWQFAYPQLGVSVTGAPNAPPEFALPIGETSRFNVTSVDVDHSFWVPAFLFKRDAIPGLANTFDWKPTKLGTYRGTCGEFCGLDHALMTFTLRVVSRSEFSRWIRQHHNVPTTTAAFP